MALVNWLVGGILATGVLSTLSAAGDVGSRRFGHAPTRSPISHTCSSRRHGHLQKPLVYAVRGSSFPRAMALSFRELSITSRRIQIESSPACSSPYPASPAAPLALPLAGWPSGSADGTKGGGEKAPHRRANSHEMMDAASDEQVPDVA